MITTPRKKLYALDQAVYRVAFEHIDEIVYKIKMRDGHMRNGIVQFLSDRIRVLLGYDPQAFVDDPTLWFRLIHPDDVEMTLAVSRQIRATRQAHTRLYRFRHAATHEYHWFEDRVVPEFDNGGELVAYVGVARDVTERVRADERLRESQKLEAVGRLAGGVAHDFNNLLTVILGCADLLLNAHSSNEALRGELLQIIEAADRAAGLTQQLLAFGRRQMLLPSVISLVAVADEMAPILRRLIQEDIEIMVEHGPEVGFVKADRSQMEQIILNLVLNARDAMRTGGELRIRTDNVTLADADAIKSGRVAGPYVRLRVQDNGVGMDAATRTHIFEPFFTTKDVGQGTGLGLSTVLGVVAQSGGWIEVTSAPAEGSTFSVFLPRVSAPEPS